MDESGGADQDTRLSAPGPGISYDELGLPLARLACVALPCIPLTKTHTSDSWFIGALPMVDERPEVIGRRLWW